MRPIDKPAPHHPEPESRVPPRPEADADSETRFGPRPVPEGHRAAAGPSESRRIPPSGQVSPDGTRAYPRPSQSAKWLVWGGTALAAAAATAGTVYAARHIAALIAGDGDRQPRPKPRDTQAPGFYRPATTSRTAPERDHEAPRPQRPRPTRKARPNLMQEIQSNTASLSQGVDGVMQSLSSAVAGFRGVAGQASTIIRDFSDAAALVRDIIDAKPAPHQDRADEGERSASARSARPDPQEAEREPARHDPRTHRL